VGACMYAIFYVHPLADSRRKGRCIRRHDTYVTIPAARASAKIAGARKYVENDDHDFFEFIALHPSSQGHTRTHKHARANTHTHIGQVLGRGVV